MATNCQDHGLLDGIECCSMVLDFLEISQTPPCGRRGCLAGGFPLGENITPQDLFRVSKPPKTLDKTKTLNETSKNLKKTASQPAAIGQPAS